MSNGAITKEAGEAKVTSLMDQFNNSLSADQRELASLLINEDTPIADNSQNLDTSTQFAQEVDPTLDPEITNALNTQKSTSNIILKEAIFDDQVTTADIEGGNISSETLFLHLLFH